MSDVEELISLLLSSKLAEIHWKETNKTVSANDKTDVADIILNDKSHVYIPWREAWDAEDETSIKYEEFEGKGIADTGATFTINKITTANQSLERMKLTALYQPIAGNLSIRFTNSTGTQKWARHIWQGIKIRRSNYNKYIKPFVEKKAKELGINIQLGAV